MPRYLADTSAWNRSARIVDRWSELLEAGEIALCAPVQLELLYSARGRAEYASLADDLRGLPALPMDRGVDAAATRSQAALAARGQHRGPRPVDILIAAVAQVHGVILLHYDRHFDLIARETGQDVEWVARRGTLD